jgi:integrase
MKAGKEHQVALSKAAMRVLHKVRAITEGIGGAVGASALVFPNDRTGGQLSEAALSSILSRMKFDGITVHGFRSAFRDWAGEESHFPSDIAEMALAHSVGDKTERAYRRKTGFNKRRLLAEAWAGYCSKPPVASDGKVLAFSKSSLLP